MLEFTLSNRYVRYGFYICDHHSVSTLINFQSSPYAIRVKSPHHKLCDPKDGLTSDTCCVPDS